MTANSSKIDLIAEARDHLAASVASDAALVIHRLKQNPSAPDAVIWHATKATLEARGHPTEGMDDRYPTNPSLVSSLLDVSEHYSASEVSV